MSGSSSLCLFTPSRAPSWEFGIQPTGCPRTQIRKPRTEESYPRKHETILGKGWVCKKEVVLRIRRRKFSSSIHCPGQMSLLLQKKWTLSMSDTHKVRPALAPSLPSELQQSSPPAGRELHSFLWSLCNCCLSVLYWISSHKMSEQDIVPQNIL